jgi:hypothetical protein
MGNATRVLAYVRCLTLAGVNTSWGLNSRAISTKVLFTFFRLTIRLNLVVDRAFGGPWPAVRLMR